MEQFFAFLLEFKSNIIYDVVMTVHGSRETGVFFALWVLWPNARHGLLFREVSRSQTATHNSRYDSFGRVISPTQRCFIAIAFQL
jgi:hypothetical protein